MFDCTAAQFLAILEALSDSSRHVLRPAPPVPDEIEIRDVISELFFAGLEILSGNSIKNQKKKKCWRAAQTSVFFFFFLCYKRKNLPEGIYFI